MDDSLRLGEVDYVTFAYVTTLGIRRHAGIRACAVLELPDRVAIMRAAAMAQVQWHGVRHIAY